MDLNAQRDELVAWLKPTGWRWVDPVWAPLAESDLICPCGNHLELDAPSCHCGEKNPVVLAGLI